MPTSCMTAALARLAAAAALLGVGMIGVADAHGGLTTPLARNSFNQPLNPGQPGKFGGLTNYCAWCTRHTF